MNLFGTVDDAIHGVQILHFLHGNLSPSHDISGGIDI
jgi:hypothetical protein